MHEALCRPSDTTLDILHVESRAADHSANMGSSTVGGDRLLTASSSLNCDATAAGTATGDHPANTNRDATAR